MGKNHPNVARFRTMGRLCACTAFLVPVPLLAQSVGSASQSVTQGPAPVIDEGHLQEIVVTAQKRGQNLQKVPLSVSAFSGSTLAKSGVTNVREISRVVPALNIDTGSGVILPFLRGVGNPSGYNAGNESSVPIYIDNVYYSRLSPALLDLANVERVEVLEGPQGTLFGRNAEAGAIQIFTRDPGQKSALEATMGYGNYQTAYGKLYAATPISDDVAADIAISGLHQGKGWGHNLTTGEETDKNKYINVRSKIIVTPTPTTKIRLIGFYAAQRTGQGVQNDRYEGTLGATPPLPIYGPIRVQYPSGFYDSIGTVNAFVRNRGGGGSVEIDQQTSLADLVSITAYRTAKEYYLTEGDKSPQNFLQYVLNTVDSEFTQEFQVKSKSSSSFDWIAGAFYISSRQGYSPTDIFGDAYGPGIAQHLYGIQKIHSYSGYGQATFHVIPEGTDVTLGLRYNSDHVRGIGFQTLTTPAGTIPLPAALGGQDPYDKTFVFNKLSYKVALDHKFGNNVMAYASVSRGYKSGTFNTLPLNNDPSQSEVDTAYEAGIKTELLDRRLRFNVAIFQSDIKNPQVTTIIAEGSTSFVGLTNAKKARSRGIEVSANAIAAKGLNLRVSGTYLDARYTDFKNAPFNYPVSALPEDGGMCPGAILGSPDVPATTGGLCPTVTRDASGHTLAQVPKWRVSGGVNYTLDTNSGSFVFDGSFAYTSRFAWDADNFIKQRPYTLFDASLTYHLPDNDRYSIRFWGKNITNVHYYATELPQTGGAAVTSGPAAPRTFGVEVGVKL